MLLPRFRFNRWTDESQISGVGIVLHGCVLPSGRVVVEWRQPRPTITIYQSMDEFRSIHLDAHPGCAAIEWFEDVDGGT